VWQWCTVATPSKRAEHHRDESCPHPRSWPGLRVGASGRHRTVEQHSEVWCEDARQPRHPGCRDSGSSAPSTAGWPRVICRRCHRAPSARRTGNIYRNILVEGTWTDWWRPARPRSSPRNARRSGRPGCRAPTAGRRGASPGRPDIGPAAACRPRRRVHIVHCLVQRRPDGLGAKPQREDLPNRQQRRGDRAGQRPARNCCPNSAPSRPMSCCNRWHGIGPMGGTDLDAILAISASPPSWRSGQCETSRSPNLVMDAVNVAYRVVLPRDAVAGSPPTTPTPSSTTRCHCWRRSPPPTNCSRRGASGLFRCAHLL